MRVPAPQAEGAAMSGYFNPFDPRPIESCEYRGSRLYYRDIFELCAMKLKVDRAWELVHQ